MSFQCEYCNNIFPRKGSLKNHQKRAKYCILIQEEKQNERNVLSQTKDRIALYEEKVIIYDNTNRELKKQLRIQVKSYENKIASLKKCYEERLAIQRESYEERLLHKSKQVETYQKHIFDLNKSGRNININNTNNTSIQNLQVLSAHCFQDGLEYLNVNHILGGAEGLARYALEYPLKDRVVCSDHARSTLKYKDVNGSVITDPGGKRLSNMLFDSMGQKTSEIRNGYDPDGNFYGDERRHQLLMNCVCIDKRDKSLMSATIKEIGLHTYNKKYESA